MELCVIEGDGVGHEVIPAAVEVLKTLFPNLKIHRAGAGWDYFQAHGFPVSEATIELARRCGAVLFGAANSPSYPVDGYYSPIVRMRRLLKVHANIRPISYLPVSTARAGVDLIVVRENTEDVYLSQEKSSNINGEKGTVQKIVTRAATEKISHTAFQLARLAKRRLVTIVHKGNVLPQTDGLFRRVAFEVAEQYKDIQTDELLVDTAAYWMVKEPTRFDIILTSNQYGDILSDMAAAWGGGLGFIPALNLGDDVGIAEPVHGSAPDIAGKGMANPTGAILSAAMLIRYHWQKPQIAEQVEAAVRNTIDEGAYTADVKANGAVTTGEFAQLICQKLQAATAAS
ncbi:MAG: isocitrate/isopropylmalate dehydrogenase family protein [Anaerolineae bacterium]|nr:isocitrate/isopropylmalate dehydrogenase family protein [Anaerolineae bacterium]MDQ7036552.1 isocitrate/isopropylmalate dehydrogenase family protein [Anaerolineae bacterium]